MSDTTELLPTDAAPQAVTEPSATAAPEIQTEQPAEQVTKTFSQEEVDALITKRLAKEQRKWERKLTQPQAPSTPQAPPSADQFANVEDYAQALAERKAQELVQRQEAQRQQEEILETYREREEAAREKYDDFESVALNPKLPITQVMAQAIQASDTGPDVAYYLGTNPKEAERIAKLPAILQAKEIGKIEAKVAATPPVKKSSAAPTPISPVTSRASGSPAYDTTDPRSTKNMTTSQWIEAEMQRQIRQWEQRNRVS